MSRLTDRAHDALREVLRPGGTAVDATAGNGHDTQFLAEQVGPAGTVFALDVQPEAVAQTTRRLTEAGLGNVTLLLADHADLPVVIPPRHHGRVDAVTFNLGYRPGGDKSVTTRAGTTVAALRAAIDLLRSGGVVTVLAYPGHPTGLEECAAVEDFLRALSSREAAIDEILADSASTTAPRLFVVRKR